MRQQNNTERQHPAVAIIPAPRTIPGKTPHRCPWHDDSHPSAVTFFHPGGKCLTFCAAERKKEWGEYEIVGGNAYIYPLSRRFRPRVSVLPPAQPDGNEEKQDIAHSIFVRFCFSVYRKEKPRPLSSLGNDDFWYLFLVSKRVNVPLAAQVENPPCVISVGILFPTHTYYQSRLVPHSGQLRTVGIKSLSLWKPNEGRHLYIPLPLSIRNFRRVVVVESPFVALRLSYLGIPAIATLGKVDAHEEITRALSPAIPVFIWDEPGTGHMAQDFDMLSDAEIQRRFGMATY